MPINYSCDICGKDVGLYDNIGIRNSKKLELLCLDCWKPAEELLTSKLETVDVNQG